MLIALAIGLLVYFFTVLFKFALSRKREYLADAGAVEMTKNPEAMVPGMDEGKAEDQALSNGRVAGA